MKIFTRWFWQNVALLPLGDTYLIRRPFLLCLPFNFGFSGWKILIKHGEICVSKGRVMMDRQKERPREQLHRGKMTWEGWGHRFMMIETAMGILLPQTKTYLKLSAAGRELPRVTGQHALRCLDCRLVDSRSMEGKHYSALPCVAPRHCSPRR